MSSEHGESIGAGFVAVGGPDETPPHSLPLVGKIVQTRVHSTFGPHHIGLTTGPKTGRLVADMIAQNYSYHDFRPLEPMRFAAGK